MPQDPPCPTRYSSAHLTGLRDMINKFQMSHVRVVRKVDNTIRRINHYPVDNVVCFVNTYSLDSDLSGG